MSIQAAGTDPGQRKLNGPQTTGRTYRNLSEPAYAVLEEPSVELPMRDGITLRADLHRPRSPGRFPALVASSPYPRQLQNSGAPMGFIEAGATDFWVPRGYVHVIVNDRGTGGSGGQFGFYDQSQRNDMHDVVEWAAAQPWCDGNVGMIGISGFAMAQIAGAVTQPPHLRAIFPMAATTDTYEALYHGGLLSMTFGPSWLNSVAMFAPLTDGWFRNSVVRLIETVLRSPKIHAKLAHFNGESAIAMLKSVMSRVPHDPHPWNELSAQMCVQHQLKDAFWQDRDNQARVPDIRVPVYLGCDWENVPLHLNSTFAMLRDLPKDIPVRLAMLGQFGLTWPWESMHVEALAWFDHFLKGHDTGILDGAPIRYVIPGDPEERWYEAATWPPPEAVALKLALRSDGGLAAEEGTAGSREYVVLPPWVAGLAPGLPTTLTWETAPLSHDVVLAGQVTLALAASLSGGDSAFIVTLQDVAPDGTLHDVTAGWRRAAMTPDLTAFAAVPAGELRTYDIKLVDNARRFRAGHRIRLFLRADDSVDPAPIMGFRHAPVGVASHNSVASSSRLTLDVLPG